MSEQPNAMTAGVNVSVDALSDILELIRFRGDGLTMTRGDAGAETAHPPHERLVHYVERGAVDLVVDGAVRERVAAGQLVLLARGATHRLRVSDDAVWLSGWFVVEEHIAAPLLAALPDVIVLNGTDPGLEWLPLGAQLLAAEVVEPTAGSRVMVSRLLDLLFIRTLREWADSGSVGGDAGWLTAALDRPLGPAMRAIHRSPGRAWTVDEMAGLAQMSRAAFAARFTRLVGEPPIRYLARLRLARAADLLAGTTDLVGDVGKAVGYSSEPAFSRAFTREYGVAPTRWRERDALDGDASS